MSLQSRARKRHIPTPDQRRAADPGHSAWVGASAGSGKTQVLTDRLMRLLLTGADPAAILCLTYTKAGASEMAARLFQRLSEWSSISAKELEQSLSDLTGEAPDARQIRLARSLFAKALATPGGLKVQTIHAFCERLLQLFPIEAGLVPGFRVLDEVESAGLMRDAITHSLQDEDEQVAEGWAFLSEGDVASLDQLETTMSALLGGQGGMREALQRPQGAQEALLKIAMALELVPIPSAQNIEAEMAAIDEAQYRDWRALASKAGVKTYPELLADILAGPGEARLAALRAVFITKDGLPATGFLTQKWVKNTGILDDVLSEQQRIIGLHDKLLRLQVFEATLAVYRAASNVLERIESLKRQRGLYDFDDLIARTRQLLGNSAHREWVRYKLDPWLSHVLVDEAQDTSPAQWDIVKALVEDFFAGQGIERETPRTLFVVGDRKQSIFSFQGADVRAFDTAQAELAGRIKGSGTELQNVGLSVSYRSLGAVLKAVDAVFASGMPARTGFGAAEDDVQHVPTRIYAPGLIEIWPVVPKPDEEEPQYWKAPVDRPPRNHPRRRLAQLIATEIKSWIGRRRVPGKSDPLQPGDIMILLQSRSPLFAALIAELRRNGVPVAGADRLRLEDNIIVADLMMLIQWLTLPGDDHALACLLKSPLVPEPVTEDQLFRLAHGRGHETLWQRLEADPAQGENCRRLSDYRVLAQDTGPYSFLARITQLCRKPIAQRLGSEAEDVIRELLEMALAFEQRETTSLFGFARWFAAGEHVIKREMDPKAGEVRIMTVHGAKGLEAPIVFLADADDISRGRDESRLLAAPESSAAKGLCVFLPQLDHPPKIISEWKDQALIRREQERMRLLYVGMTRAMDALYICGAASGKAKNETSWWKLAENALGGSPLPVSAIPHPDLDGPVIRFGEAPQFLDDALAVGPPEPPPVPDWAAPVGDAPMPPERWRFLARDDPTFDSTAADEGMAVHRFLELAAGKTPAQRQRLALRLGLKWERAQRLAALLDAPDLQPFFAPGSEAEVVIAAPGLGLNRIDRMARANGVIHILDFKSGTPQDQLPADHPYVRQMARYAALLRDAYPGEEVRAALLWTQTGRVDWIPEADLAEP